MVHLFVGEGGNFLKFDENILLLFCFTIYHYDYFTFNTI